IGPGGQAEGRVVERPAEREDRTRRVGTEDVAERGEVAYPAVVEEDALVVVEEPAADRRQVHHEGDGGGDEGSPPNPHRRRRRSWLHGRGRRRGPAAFSERI